MIDFEKIIGFNWDHGNQRKSADKHGVSQSEAEQVFFNDPLLMVEDIRHNQTEPRFHALGKTNSGRRLHVTFTLREDAILIRVISARDMTMGRQDKAPPSFKTEAEERAFWEVHDSSDHVAWDQAERVCLPNLKPSTKAISLRLPISLLEQIKITANKRDVPYQSLIKIWLAEKVKTG
ncbi:MAG: BrnT family toxin [Magnetococcales bacterium]|nr:BrnT family toxin [Magnetococcales bacterium]